MGGEDIFVLEKGRLSPKVILGRMRLSVSLWKQAGMDGQA